MFDQLETWDKLKGTSNPNSFLTTLPSKSKQMFEQMFHLLPGSGCMVRDDIFDIRVE
jgi:hypothetical protein